MTLMLGRKRRCIRLAFFSFGECTDIPLICIVLTSRTEYMYAGKSQGSGTKLSET